MTTPMIADADDTPWPFDDDAWWINQREADDYRDEADPDDDYRDEADHPDEPD